MSTTLRAIAVAFLVASVVAPNRATGQERGGDAKIGIVKALADGEKRDWLRERMTATPPGARRGAEIRARLARMNPLELDRLVEAYYRQQAMARANLRRGGRGGVSRYGYGYSPYQRGAVGYAPVISWLPTGTSLQTGAVISPDGRSVRISAQPFFSSVPYYDTFNMANGQTRRYYVQGQPQRQPQRQATPYRYHDGLRTHYKPPQMERYNDGLRTRYRPIQR